MSAPVIVCVPLWMMLFWMLKVNDGVALALPLTKTPPAPAIDAIDCVIVLLVKTKSPVGVAFPFSRYCTKCEREPVNVELLTVTFIVGAPEAGATDMLSAALPNDALL